MSYTITDVLFGDIKNQIFLRELDFGFQSKCAARERRQMVIRHRAKYEGTYDTVKLLYRLYAAGNNILYSVHIYFKLQTFIQCTGSGLTLN